MYDGVVLVQNRFDTPLRQSAFRISTPALQLKALRVELAWDISNLDKSQRFDWLPGTYDSSLEVYTSTRMWLF